LHIKIFTSYSRAAAEEDLFKYIEAGADLVNYRWSESLEGN